MFRMVSSAVVGVLGGLLLMWFGGAETVLLQRVVSPLTNSASGGSFGYDVAFVDRTRFVVTDRKNTVAYVFQVGESAHKWELQSGSANEGFGEAVAVLDGDIVAVGAPERTIGTIAAAGSVYLFGMANPSADPVNSFARLDFPVEAGNPAQKQWFGTILTADGTRLGVGQPDYDAPGKDNWGRAYVYDFGTTKPAAIAQQLQAGTVKSYLFSNPGPTTNLPKDQGKWGEYGFAIAFWGDRVAIGGPFNDPPDEHGKINGHPGTVHLYDLTGADPTKPVEWIAGLQGGTNLGYRLQAAGDSLVCGLTRGKDRAHVYTRASFAAARTTRNVLPQQTLVVNTPPTRRAFGYALASGDPGQFAVGDTYNGVFIFQNDLTPGQRIAPIRHIAQPNGGEFGWSLDATGNLLLVGAPNETVAGHSKGAAYLYRHQYRFVGRFLRLLYQRLPWLTVVPIPTFAFASGMVGFFALAYVGQGLAQRRTQDLPDHG